jgi:hypothetical protein
VQHREYCTRSVHQAVRYVTEPPRSPKCELHGLHRNANAPFRRLKSHRVPASRIGFIGRHESESPVVRQAMQPVLSPGSPREPALIDCRAWASSVTDEPVSASPMWREGISSRTSQSTAQPRNWVDVRMVARLRRPPTDGMAPPLPLALRGHGTAGRGVRPDGQSRCRAAHGHAVRTADGGATTEVGRLEATGGFSRGRRWLLRTPSEFPIDPLIADRSDKPFRFF